tara:strand:- start:576 stop:1667 length:1092 start_codon:yes stop_codon:yes gene_type:complete
MKIEQYPVIIEGSVKNVREVTEPTETQMGEYLLEFTDDTSVKDRGKLGFKTPNKGASMCATAVNNFAELDAMGIPHVFKEQVADNAILVDAVRVINPDEHDLRGDRKNRLFPVEVITRDVVTDTSSAAKRLRSGTLHYSALGLSEQPTDFPVFLPKTFVDGSTKLRNTGDDYLPWDQLKELACATTEDMNTVQAYVLQTTALAQRRGSEIGFLVFDHKDEYAYDADGRLVLADVPLCLDEVTGALVGPYNSLDQLNTGSFGIFRAGLTHEGHVNASKQLFRDHYDACHPEWCAAVKTALGAGVPKSQLPTVPQPPEELIGLVSNIYQAFTNEWTGVRTFDVPSLVQCVQDYRTWAVNFYELKP